MKMNIKRNIEIEVEKTLESTSDYKKVEGNPFLITRINSEIDHKRNNNSLSGFKLKPIFLTLVVLLNIYTGISFYFSPSESNNSDELISLMEEFSISNEKYDINFLDDNNLIFDYE